MNAREVQEKGGGAGISWHEIEKVEFHARELSVNEAETIEVPEKYDGRQVDQTQEQLFGQVLLPPTNRRSQLAQKAS